MSVLNEIIAGVREDLAVRQLAVSLDDLKRAAARQLTALDPMPGYRAPGVSVIAEVKRSSPSMGSLADISDPAALAVAYARGGAATISVLTEQRWFAGTLDDLRAVRAAVEVPVLCKDFIVTSYQLWEARAAGADLALLIVAALDDNELCCLIDRARSIGLTPLVEVHSEDEAKRALEAGADLIGVNARDLTTLEVDRDTFARVAPLLPESVVRVAESGVRGPHDVLEYARGGADVVLVGETLVTGKNPGTAVSDMVAAGAHPALKRRH
ncbi:MAG: indole-3-glycerol phosphate synthase TrpC [Actinomycetota bacterium]|nr:indole-3-glycerol phosphate synthase TrpC [Actinomycetota bacterium]